MNCSHCRHPFLACHCPDLDRQIEVFLLSPGQQVGNAVHNRLVWRAAEVVDVRINQAEQEFFRRFPDARTRRYRKRRLWGKRT